MEVSDSEVAELLFRPERVDSSDEDERAQARGPPQRPSSSASAQQRPRASRPRPTSAPCRGELQVMDLQVMTAEAVSLFRAGRQQDALDIAVAFSDLAQNQLGRRHPTFINALATVAAFVDQMGCSKEADALLEEAEGLHQELEMEALERHLEAELEKLSDGGEEEEAAVETGGFSPSRPRPKGGRSGPGGAFLTGVDGQGSSQDDESSADEAGNSDSGDQGDIDALEGIDDDEDEGDVDDEDDESEEAEAEAITRLTWEVNALLQQNHPEEAADLLTEAEQLLLRAYEEDEGSAGQLRGMTRAALHTLWAAVLESVGEEEKAQTLYDEALNCLKEEAALDSTSSSEGSEAEEGEQQEEDDGENEEEEEEEVEVEKSKSEDLRPKGLDVSQSKERPEMSFRSIAEHRRAKQEEELERLQSLELQKLQKQKDQQQEEERQKNLQLQELQKKAHEVQEQLERQRQESAEAQGEALSETKALDLGRNDQLVDEAAGVEASPSESAHREIPSSSSASSPSKPKALPSKAPQAKALQAKPPPAKAPQGVVRVGGGFAIPAPPKASPGRKPAPALRRPKAKASAAAAADTPDRDASPAADSPEPDLPGEAEKPSSEEQLKREVSRALVTADHYMGMLKFEQAADRLEEQLARLSSDDSPLKHSDLHVEVLQKYGGILWWDNDFEGAIDAFSAVDEVLEDREAAEIDPGIRRRRASIWSQLAQLHRACGELDLADDRLTMAVASLKMLLKDETRAEDAATATLDQLRDAQAALGQVCVHKEEFDRAEKLYLAAFSLELGEAVVDEENETRQVQGVSQASSSSSSSSSGAALAKQL